MNAWQDRALCRGVDTVEFYPDRGGYRQAARALAYCWSCACWVECLRWALETGDDHAVLGRTVARDRRRMGRLDWVIAGEPGHVEYLELLVAKRLAGPDET